MDEAGSRSRRAGVVARLAIVLALVLPLLAVAPASAQPPANEHFARTWARTDRPVADLNASRTWMWGPVAHGGALAETYLEAPAGKRTVQYYDKSRMEITDPTGDAASGWFVTNGLLVVELVSGRLQAGDDAFVQLPPAAVNVAGDPDDPSGPTYATIATLLDAPPAAPGTIYTQRLARNGSVASDQALAGRGITAALVDDVTHHAIAAPFWAFMNSSGAVWDDGELRHDRLFENSYYATGRPIGEAYWATVRVGGTPRDVLLQCFERRCLTFTPDNDLGWQVEAGNVGQHYFKWRYQSGHDYTAVWVDGDAATTVTHGAASITILDGSLSGPAIVSIAPTSTGKPFPGFLAVGGGWRVEVSGADLMAPVALSFAIDPARLPAGSEASTVRVAFFDETAGRWIPVATTLDLTASRASVTTPHLSLWQLFVPADPDGGDPPGSDPPPPGPPGSIPPTPTPTPTPPPNVAPEVDLNGLDVAGRDGRTAMQAGGEPIVVAPFAQVIDPDDDTLLSIVVELLDGPDGAEERLSAMAIPSVVVSTDSDGRRLQLGGPASRTALQQVLRTVRYQHDGDEHATAGDRRIAVRAADDAGPGPVAYVTVGVTPAPANRAPEAGDITATTDEDVPVSIALSATDPDGDGLTWAVVTSPQHGSLSGVAPDLVYTPSPDYHGTDSFTWSAIDARGASTTATVSIAVAPVNDPPIAHAAAIGTDEEVAVPITLSGSDVDGDTLTFAITMPPARGTLSGDAPLLVYTPDADFSGDDSFAFTVSDGVATSDPATVAITVRAVNDPPAASGQQVTTDEDVPVPITLGGTDDDSTVAFTIIDAPLHGALTGEAPYLTYSPNQDFNGSDAFTYAVSDGEHTSDPATVSIIINPVNDSPVASAQSITLLEDGNAYFTVTGSDIDGDVVRFAITRSPVLGNVSVDGDWRCVPDSMPRVCSHVIHYGALADITGTDSFEFTVNDGNLTSAPATVTITILPVNDPPIARDDTAATDEDASDVTIDALANDSTGPDDGETLTIASVESFSNGGSAVVSGGVLLYTPAADFYGTETFRYTISDGNGGEASATATVNVAGVNDPPTATDDTFVLDEDSGPTPLDLLANDSIVPDRDETLTISGHTLPSHGSLTVNQATGAVSYRPDADYFGADSFSYTISDGNGGSATATVTLTVRPVNDPPVAFDDAVTIFEDSGPVTIEVLANDTFAPDVGETLVVTGVSSASLGTAEVASGGAAVRFTPLPNAFGTDTFTYTVADDGGLTATATVTVTITPVNDPPVLQTAGASLTYVEDAAPLALVPDLTVADVDSDIASATVAIDARPDGAAESLSVTTGHAAISVTVDDLTGSVTLRGVASPADYQQVLRSLHYVNSSQAPTSGNRVVTVTVTDGEASESVSISVDVVPVNDPPVLTFGGIVLPDAGPVVLDTEATLTDIDSPDFDGGQLSATITGGYDAGDVLSVQPGGSLGIAGSSLTWGATPAVVIGQLAVSDGLLVVTFTGAANPERVQAVVRALVFGTTSGSAADRLVSVVVSDGDGGGSETGIIIVGVNQPPDDISLSSASIPEDAVAGTVIGTITGSDPNGDALSFALVAGSDARFEIAQDGSDWQLRVAGGAAFDHEMEPDVVLAIRASDPGGRSYDESFAIAVTDVNEPPALDAAASFEIDENSPAGTVAGIVGVIDPDAGQSHAFSITAGNDAGAFAIDGATGQITVADSAPLDFETTPSFQLTVTVTDDGAPPLSGSGTVTVMLVDVPEDVVDTEPPVVENLTYGTLIGNLRVRGGAADGLLSTSSDPEGSALAVVAVEPYDGTAFGTLDWRPDGSFTWDPPIGARNTAGAWRFTVQDAAGHQATGLVSFDIGPRRVWHVDDAIGATVGTGRWDAPFGTLAQAATAAANGDVIYLATGSAAYTGGITLKANQALIGTGAAAASFPALLGMSPPARGSQDYPAINGTSPTITTSNGAGVTLGSGNTIDGVTFGATRGAAIAGQGGGTAIGPTIRNVAITGAGSGVGPALVISDYVGGSMSFQRIERSPGRASGAEAVVQLIDLPTTSVVVEGALQLTSSVLRGLQVEDVASVELRGGVAISIAEREGIFSEATTLRLSSPALKSISTTGKPGVWVRRQSSLVVAGGNLRITTTGANGLDLHGSTVEMTGAGTVIAATNGVALVMAQAAIVEAGVAIEAVSASGGTNGIVLNMLTSNGPIVIGPDAPDAAFGDGGTITGTSGPAILLQYASNVTLRHLVVGAADSVVGEAASKVNAVGGAGIEAAYLSDLTLDHVRIAHTGSHGIAGREVVGFTMTRSEVLNAGDAAGEHGLWFDGPAAGAENGLLGTALIADSVIDGFWDTGLVVRNAPTVETSLDLAVARTTFSGNAIAGGGIRLRAEALATIDALVEGCVFERLIGPSIDGP